MAGTVCDDVVLKEGQKLVTRAKRIGYQISEATEWTGSKIKQ